MALETTRFDAADYIKSAQDAAYFLEDALNEGDHVEFIHALGVVARSKGMTEIAALTGLSRQALYKALGKGGNPEFATVMKVLKALGLRLTPAVEHA